MLFTAGVGISIVKLVVCHLRESTKICDFAVYAIQEKMALILPQKLRRLMITFFTRGKY